MQKLIIISSKKAFWWEESDFSVTLFKITVSDTELEEV